MSPIKRYLPPPVKEYVKKLPFSFSIDKLIKSWDYIADRNNFDHKGFKHNQLALTSSIYEYDGKNIWYEGIGSMHYDINTNKKKIQLAEKDFIVFHPILKDTYFYEVYTELSTMYNLGRVRLMNFPPRVCLSWHKDENERIHIPIITNRGCHLVIQNSVHHLPADGSAYIADVTVPHTAFNGGCENRYNLLIEVLGYKE